MPIPDPNKPEQHEGWCPLGEASLHVHYHSTVYHIILRPSRFSVMDKLHIFFFFFFSSIGWFQRNFVTMTFHQFFSIDSIFERNDNGPWKQHFVVLRVGMWFFIFFHQFLLLFRSIYFISHSISCILRIFDTIHSHDSFIHSSFVFGYNDQLYSLHAADLIRGWPI